MLDLIDNITTVMSMLFGITIMIRYYKLRNILLLGVTITGFAIYHTITMNFKLYQTADFRAWDLTVTLLLFVLAISCILEIAWSMSRPNK
jgi:hypothetical protein